MCWRVSHLGGPCGNWQTFPWSRLCDDLYFCPDHMPHTPPLGGATKQMQAYQNPRGRAPTENAYIPFVPSCTGRLSPAPCQIPKASSRWTRKETEATKTILGGEFHSHFSDLGLQKLNMGKVKTDGFHLCCFLEFGSEWRQPLFLASDRKLEKLGNRSSKILSYLFPPTCQRGPVSQRTCKVEWTSVEDYALGSWAISWACQGCTVII